MTPHEAMYGTTCVTGAETLTELSHALDSFLSLRLDSGRILDVNIAFDEFMSLQLDIYDRALDDNKRIFLDEIHRRMGGVTPKTTISDELRQSRTVALWAGLQRVFFHEIEPEAGDSVMDVSVPSHELPTMPRRRGPRMPTDMNAFALPFPDNPDDSDDAPMRPGTSTRPSVCDGNGEWCEPSSKREYSNGEDEDEVRNHVGCDEEMSSHWGENLSI
jgi:hypothetical protein